jgi:hypothetical protein
MISKNVFLGWVIGLTSLVSCNTNSTDISVLRERMDSLQKQVDSAYKPGLGEFMSGIQVHHAKLYFAGANANWKLANFELGEIKETLEDVEKYCQDRPEIQSLPMIRPAMDSINAAIKVQSLVNFKSAFLLLTNTCNNCHRTTQHEFNVIKIPDTPPFTNQEYTKPR